MYPPSAMRAGVSGAVSLQVLVDRFGDVGRVVVLRPVPMLDMAAQESVMRWKFTVRAGERPARVRVVVNRCDFQSPVVGQCARALVQQISHVGV